MPAFQRDSFRLVADKMDALQARGDPYIARQAEDLFAKIRKMQH